MDYYAINALRENHAGWSLLRAQNAPLAISFFMAAFTGPNQRNLGRQQLIDSLDDVLFGLRDAYGEDKFPRQASEYLDDWAAPERAWLRKYYVPGQDEPRYDLTAAAEDVVRWVESLRGRDFVATQSRLTSIFAVLERLVQQSETDPEVRLEELQNQRDAIDAEMQRIRDGNIRVMTAPEALDHFQQLTALAKDLLSDFREVEQNFRKLDRQVREQIATWDGTQGELLESIFANQQDISSSLQGRTFQGFWDYLMSPESRRKLQELLQRATQIEALAKTDNLHAVTNLHQDWLPAVEQTQGTVRQLSQQMRRLLDDKVFLENKRIMQLIRSVESGALATREQPPSGDFMTIAHRPWTSPCRSNARCMSRAGGSWSRTRSKPPTTPTWTPAPCSASSTWTRNASRPTSTPSSPRRNRPPSRRSPRPTPSNRASRKSWPTTSWPRSRTGPASTRRPSST